VRKLRGMRGSIRSGWPSAGADGQEGGNLSLKAECRDVGGGLGRLADGRLTL
jgi:hypothetical protein